MPKRGGGKEGGHLAKGVAAAKRGGTLPKRWRRQRGGAPCQSVGGVVQGYAKVEKIPPPSCGDCAAIYSQKQSLLPSRNKTALQVPSPSQRGRHANAQSHSRRNLDSPATLRGPNSPSPAGRRIQGAEISLHRPLCRRPYLPLGRRARRSAHLLRGHRGRRRLEDQRRRHALEADLRRPSRSPPSAPSPSPRPIRTSSTSAPARPTSAAMSPAATAFTSRPTPARPGSTSGSRTARSADDRPSDQPGHRLCGGARPGLRPQSGARRLPHHRRRQDLEASAAKNADTGAFDVCFDPNNPHILFAGLWQVRRRPWEFTSGGPGSGLYVSRDGGDTWKQLGGSGITADQLKGLPEGIWGRIGVAVAPSDSRPRLRPDRSGKGRPVIAPTTAATTGRSSTRAAISASGRGTSNHYRSIPPIPTSSTRRPCGCSRASTAARPSSRSKARTTATITISGSTRKTPSA